MFVAEKILDNSMRFRVDEDLKQEWDSFCAKKKISNQAAFVALMRFAISQDELFQSMILGHIPIDSGVVEAALKRMRRVQPKVVATKGTDVRRLS